MKKFVVLFCHEVYDFDTIEEAQNCCDLFGFDYSEIIIIK